jgi:hypothetical protein
MHRVRAVVDPFERLTSKAPERKKAGTGPAFRVQNA